MKCYQIPVEDLQGYQETVLADAESDRSITQYNNTVEEHHKSIDQEDLHDEYLRKNLNGSQVFGELRIHPS